jgi:hypothetical protein
MRYEILKRDGHKCRYCGVTAAEAPIEVDAVVPEALGGSHKDPANLVAACKACNGGKSATPPDAPLVADVAEDAMRWSRAMTAAAGEMLAKASEGVDAHAHFAKAWARYGNGPRRKPLPKGPGWEHTVDCLLAAGLPMGVLEECIEIAMSQRRVAEENVFRYMCGVAWRKVRELRDRAQEIASAPDNTTGEVADAWDVVDAGRLTLARELLGQLPDDAQAHYMNLVDIREYQEEGESPQTETQRSCEAIASVLNGLLADVHYLQKVAEEAVRALPDGIGDLCFREVHERWDCGPLSNPVFRVTDALYAMKDLVHLSAARTYLDALSPEEQAEWVEFARALYSSGWHLSDERILVRAADCARSARDEHLYYTVMCRAKGEHISQCPRRGKYNVWVNELECCAEPDHEGHLTCEHHLELMVDGKGKFTVRDFTEFSDESEKVPF